MAAIAKRQRLLRPWLSERDATAQSIINTELNGVQREIVETRWLDEVVRWENLWQSQRFFHYSFRIPIIIGATTVPVLASLNAPRLATALVGLVVAILTGLEGLFRLGVRWQEGRRAATAISFEGWQFLELSGKDYEGKQRQEAYSLFLTRLEQLNERLATARLDLFGDEGNSPRRRLETST